MSMNKTKIFDQSFLRSTLSALLGNLFRGRVSAHPGYKILPAIIVTALMFTGSSSALAQTTTEIVAELQLLLSQQQYQQAYELAQGSLFEHEGDPDFDFVYGLAATETGNADKAVFAFERIASTYRNQQRVKLELARAYYLSNNLAASRTLFNEVLATNPASNVANKIRSFLDLIDQRENSLDNTLIWSISSNIGSDDNINSATELSVITLPIGDIQLSPNAQSIDDNYLDTTFGVNFIHPIDKNRSLSVSGAYNTHNNFSTDQFDLGDLSATGTFSITKDNTRLNNSLRLQRVTLANNSFQQSASLIGNLQRVGSNGWNQTLTGAFTAVRYFNSDASPTADFRDINQALVSGGLIKATGNFIHNISLYYANETALYEAGENNAKKFYGLAYTNQFALRPGHTPFVRLSLQRSGHKAIYQAFGTERDDDLFSATFGWRWQIAKQLNLNTDVTYTDNDSSINVFSYDRVKYQTGLSFQF